MWNRYEQTGGRATDPPNSGRKPLVSREAMDEVVSKIKEAPNTTLLELIDEFSLPISQAALSKRLVGLGMRYKKTLHPNRRKRTDVAEAMEAWRSSQSAVDAASTYWLDETGVNCGMTRLYGRALAGERVYEYVPDVRFERTSLMGVLGLGGVVAPLAYKGALDGGFFAGYVRERLAPTLRPGDMLVLDNLSVHKSPAMQEAVEARGAEVRFLPPYSPDMNPTEKMWSKVKAVLRKIEARTNGELFDAVGAALAMVTASDAKGWFESCGYMASQS